MPAATQIIHQLTAFFCIINCDGGILAAKLRYVHSADDKRNRQLLQLLFRMIAQSSKEYDPFQPLFLLQLNRDVDL